MHPNANELLNKHGLSRHANVIEQFTLSAIGFSLSSMSAVAPIGASRVGGFPDLPLGFSWPENKGRPLDYLLQVNLSDLSRYPCPKMPTSGLLTFFYDLYDQPWGYDPSDLNGYKVVLSPDPSRLVRWEEVPDSQFAFQDSAVTLYPMDSLPHYGSEACDELLGNMPQEDDEDDEYLDFIEAYDRLYHEGSTTHRFFGHSCNVQGDMQLEAQLVMNGLYCGDGTGYEDPRADTLAADAHEWQLLLQFDSDDRVEMWGDDGILYYWIRTEDLAAGAFDRVWMTLQCG